MISAKQYFMGRDTIYASELTPAIKTNALRTVALINVALGAFAKDTGIILTQVASGWRPLCVNCETSNAAEHSRHITADAGDIRDTANRDFARWCCRNQPLLAKIGLWVERFEWTPTWVHMQTVPPMSGTRIYRPSMAPAKCVRLPEQDQFNC